jgi:hypothetical protein
MARKLSAARQAYWKHIQRKASDRRKYLASLPGIAKGHKPADNLVTIQVKRRIVPSRWARSYINTTFETGATLKQVSQDTWILECSKCGHTEELVTEQALRIDTSWLCVNCCAK